MPRRVTTQEIDQVWKAWVRTRPRPNACRLTTDRRKLIANRIRLGYSADDLVAVIRYANEADEGWPRWMRGNNPRRRSYLDLANLLRVNASTPLGRRVELALTWLENATDDDNPASPGSPGIDLGPTGFFLTPPEEGV